MPPGGNVIGNQVKGVSILGISIDDKEVALFKCVDHTLGSFNKFQSWLVPFLVGLGETHGQGDGVPNVDTGIIYVMNLNNVFAWERDDHVLISIDAQNISFVGNVKLKGTSKGVLEWSWTTLLKGILEDGAIGQEKAKEVMVILYASYLDVQLKFISRKNLEGWPLIGWQVL
jgi:hypothetical protein